MNNKLLEYTESYISGIIALAKEESENLKRSNITTELYFKEEYKEGLLKTHKIENIQNREINQSLEATLKDWFEDGKAVECAIKLFEIELGKTKSISTLSNKELDNIFKKNKPFYNIEDVLIIEFDKYILWMILGNNE
ncbi:MAG: hypothetical protein IKQ06_03870 [Bacilli bacterium]|nr:hypothetical protein [Bacilli bacterium]